ncbi:zinc ribbon domain-containing protein [Natronomonas sp.]|uniref:zinc ribbon domain-containing protein n=1 Tax=Natronomonas sp. TaxID=2184060 RepID=UPI002610413A|nr:zinc ribbon domain-containing protein [Natronomonas sp.]
MPSCRNCGTEIGDSYNFCPTCATPQTDEATQRLEEFVDERARQRRGSAGGDVRDRVQYALGYVAVVAGLATLTAGSGLFFVLAGLVLLPPVRAAAESRLGRTLGDRPTAAAAGALTVVGAATFVFV